MHTERNAKQVSLLKLKVTLMERDTQDVLLLEKFLRKYGCDKPLDVYLFELACILSDSVRPFLRIIPWYKIVFRIKCWYKFRRKYILRNLSIPELEKYAKTVYQLEGYSIEEFDEKKKTSP